MINKDLRDSMFKEISKKLGNDIGEIVEKSIFDFSDQYAESNGTPFLLQQMYESKAEEIICILNGKNLEYIITSILTIIRLIILIIIRLDVSIIWPATTLHIALALINGASTKIKPTNLLFVRQI